MDSGEKIAEDQLRHYFRRELDFSDSDNESNHSLGGVMRDNYTDLQKTELAMDLAMTD